MRIVHAVKHCNRGGNVHVAVDLACVQAAKGHDVLYVSAGGEYAPLLASYGVKQEEVLQNSRNLLLPFQTILRLVELSLEFKPDIIHAHMMSSAVFGYAVSKLTGIPLVTTVHNSFDRHSFLMRLGRIVVAVSDAERNLLLARGYRPDRVVTILNGPNQSPREQGLRPDRDHPFPRPSITTVCGLLPRKGVHDILRAFSELQADFPNWYLNIIGDGPERQKLETLANSLGISQSVNFLGYVYAPKSFLLKSDIFVLMSYADPCCLAIAEARETGCAIIASSVGGTPEILEQGRAGQLVQPGRPDQLAHLLRKLMRDKKELLAWQERSKTGSEFFNVYRMAEDYERVYRKLMTKP